MSQTQEDHTPNQQSQGLLTSTARWFRDSLTSLTSDKPKLKEYQVQVSRIPVRTHFLQICEITIILIIVLVVGSLLFLSISNKIYEQKDKNKIEIKNCTFYFQQNHCQKKERPQLIQSCLQWQICKDKDPNSLDYFKILLDYLGQCCKSAFESFGSQGLLFLIVIISAISIIKNIKNSQNNFAERKKYTRIYQ